ncbi:MAG: DNA-binding LytR/AlgR family response regulator [Clostridium sp.]|jgi:DNA-binding LytR/AlgR family response regulator
MMKVLIVDDEKYIRDELKYFCEKFSDVVVCGETGEGNEAVIISNKLKPDIVFLDIQLNDISGLLVARKIREQKDPPFIVFATAYDKYAIEGFEIDAIDYILKPFSEDRIKVSIDRIKNQLSKLSIELPVSSMAEININKLCVMSDNKLMLIDMDEIQYIECQNKDIIVYSKNKEYLYKHSLKELEGKFKNKKFVRTHKSFIVNVDFIHEIIPWFNYTYKVTINGKQEVEIPVSRYYLKNFKDLLGI